MCLDSGIGKSCREYRDILTKHRRRHQHPAWCDPECHLGKWQYTPVKMPLPNYQKLNATMLVLS